MTISPGDVIDGVLAGEGGPDEVVAARGLAVVSDDGALTAAVDAAIAANPDVAAKIRDGKTTAAGVLVGAVMKATRGQADATRVRELILERLSLASHRGAAPSGLRRARQAGRSGARRPAPGCQRAAQQQQTGRPRPTGAPAGAASSSASA